MEVSLDLSRVKVCVELKSWLNVNKQNGEISKQADLLIFRKIDCAISWWISSNNCNNVCWDPWLQVFCRVTLTFKLSQIWQKNLLNCKRIKILFTYRPIALFLIKWRGGIHIFHSEDKITCKTSQILEKGIFRKRAKAMSWKPLVTCVPHWHKSASLPLKIEVSWPSENNDQYVGNLVQSKTNTWT